MEEKAIRIFRFSLSSRLTLILAAEIAGSILLSLFALLLFIKIGDDVLGKEVFAYDSNIVKTVYALRTLQMTEIMLVITFFGSAIFLVCSSVLMILYLLVKRRKDALIFSSILYSGVLLNLLLKNMFHRPRPTLLPLVHENTFSFPSGHAMNSFVFYTGLTYFILRETKNVKLTIIISVFSAIMILLIGFSRVYLGAHYPSDVIAGYIAGFVWFTMAIVFEKTIIFERLYRFTMKNKQEK